MAISQGTNYLETFRITLVKTLRLSNVKIKKAFGILKCQIKFGAALEFISISDFRLCILIKENDVQF